MTSELLLEQYKLPILATAAYFIVYYLFIISVGRTKFSIIDEIKETHKKRNPGTKLSYGIMHDLLHEHPKFIAADRTQLNMLEQMPPFLVGLWMHAVFVSPETAAQLGFFYTAIRALYPFFYGSMAVLIVTIPNYITILYLVISTALQAYALI